MFQSGKKAAAFEDESKTQRPKKKSDIIRSVLYWFFLIVFLVSLGMLGRYAWIYYSSNRTYDDLFHNATLAEPQTSPTKEDKPQNSLPEETKKDPNVIIIIDPNGVIKESILDEDNSDQESKPEETDHVREDIFPPDFPGINHALLSQMNPDYVGYIFIPGTNIKYPVVQGKDNSHYLRYDFNGKEIISGCPFMDCNQANDFSGFNTTICGHNQKDDKMFGTLDRYRSKEFWEENPYIYIMTPNASYRYKVFAAYEQYYISFVFAPFHSSLEDKNKLLNHIRANQLYDTGINVTPDDHILTLFTCTSNSDVRFVLHAVCENP